MSYVNPFHPMFHGWPLASGLGMHTDEASSAMPDIEDQLPPAVARDIERQEARENPGPAKKQEPPVAPQRDISEAAMWITGMWGPSAQFEERRRGFLPVVHENPSNTLKLGMRPQSFWDRMRLCHASLSKLRNKAEAEYDRRKVTKRDWQDAFEDCMRAVEFVLGQEHAKERTILSSIATPGKSGELAGALGIERWMVVAVKGNSKLPFAAYSEFPLATCIGAGACWQYCYSFKALRYPAAFRRLFLNTLANYADREFAILKASGGKVIPPEQYEMRVRLALAGSEKPGYRIWPGIVKGIVLNSTRQDRMNAPMFLRLFVDGDINYEDNIIEWMRVCHDIGLDGADIETVNGQKLHHVEVYGYSKCWQQFVNVDMYLRNESQAKYHKNGGWPKNYTVNMSDASVYADPRFKDIRNAMMELPVTRGYFKVVNLKEYITELSQACREFGGCQSPDLDKIIESNAPTAGMPISARRVRTLTAINEIQTAADVAAIFPGLAEDALRIEKQYARQRSGKSRPKKAGKKKVTVQDKLRQVAMQFYIGALIRDESWGLSKMIRDELVADEKAGGASMGADSVEGIAEKTSSQEDFLGKLVDKQINGLNRFIAKEARYKEQSSLGAKQIDEMAKVQALRIDRILKDRDAGRDVKARIKKAQPFFDAYVAGKDIRPLVREAFAKKLQKAGAEIEKGRESRQARLALQKAGKTEELRELIKEEFFKESSLEKKAVAIALHETYWALNLGGSCPLVCGNCTDNPQDPANGAHRCASREGRDHSTGLFWHKTIHIGLH